MNRKVFSPLYIIVFIAIAACAKLGSPTGGPKDTDPPKVKKSKPANYSVGYKQNKVVIKFDEYIVLKDQVNEFTVSPPLEKKPIPLGRGQSIVIDLPSSKLDSVTYTLDFGQAIQDNTEGNKLTNYQFVVSKQSHIDSFTVSGKVVDALTKQPDKERIAVYLHNNLSDTAFCTAIPRYLGRTDPKGNFTINHIAPGTYSVFALKDMNNNLMYDLPNEAIAFGKQPVFLYPDSFPETKIPADSIKLSSKPDKNKADTLSKTDSVFKMVYGFTVDLFSFTEEAPYKQYLADYSRNAPENFTLIFNNPVADDISLRLLKPDTTGKWYYTEKNPTSDTLVFWLADSNLVLKDSIVVEITYPFTDTTQVTSPKTDTLVFRLKSEKTASKGSTLGRQGKRTDKSPNDTIKKVPRMAFETNINKGSHDLNVPIKITALSPVSMHNKNLFKLSILKDTIETPVSIKLRADETNRRNFILDFEPEQQTTYKLDLYEGLFTDIYNRTIDSTSITFTTQREGYYGAIKTSFKNVNQPIIVQLLGTKDIIVQQKEIVAEDVVYFGYLKPGKYRLRIIADENKNGKWDTGNFKLLKQPERVDYFSKEIEVRSNWEVENTWEVKWK